LNNISSKIYHFWLQHIHSFFITVRFLSALADALPTAVVTVYLLGKGLTFTEIGVVWSVSLFFSTLLDFPTGNFADIYGRKHAFVIGITSVGIGHVIYGMGSTLWVFYVAALFTGFGTAQISGSLTSWVVDEQIKSGKKDEVSRIFGDAAAAASVGGVIGGISVGLFFTGPLEILYFVSAAILFIAGAFVFISIPDNYGKPSGRWISLPQEVISHYIHSFPLVILSISLILMFACYTVFLFVWQPSALEFGIQKGDLGFLYAIFMAGTVVGALVMGRICQKIGEVITLLSCFLLSGIGFVIISMELQTMGLTSGLILFAIGFGGFLPVLYAYMNTFVPSSIRASTSSLFSTIGTGGVILLQVGIGAFIEVRGIVPASITATVFSLLGIAFLITLLKKGSEKPSTESASD
jgi:MFS family permease